MTKLRATINLLGAFFVAFILTTCTVAALAAQQVPSPANAAMYAARSADIRYYQALLNLSDWEITLTLGSLPADFVANTISNPMRKQALVTLDSVAIRAEQEPWRVILHEMLHIATSQAHGFTFHLAADPEAQGIVQYLFEDLVQRMTMWRVWQPPKEE